MLTVREALERRLNKIAHLPTMPQILFKLQEALRCEHSAADSIAAIVREDPALTAAILRIANSVAYQSRVGGRISSIPQAIVRLGFVEIQRICVSMVMVQVFQGFGKGIDHEEFWRHSLTVATATSLFRQYSSRAGDMTDDLLEDAFIGGLLHDVGILVMDQFFPELFSQVRELAEAKPMPLSIAETEILGIHHGEIGAKLLADWKLPERVVEAICWHHDPDQSREENRPVAQMIHLADFICVNQAIGNAQEGFYEGFSEGAWHDLGLSVDQIPDMLEDIKQEAAKSEIMGGAV